MKTAILAIAVLALVAGAHGQCCDAPCGTKDNVCTATCVGSIATCVCKNPVSTCVTSTGAGGILTCSTNSGCTPGSDSGGSSGGSSGSGSGSGSTVCCVNACGSADNICPGSGSAVCSVTTNAITNACKCKNQVSTCISSDVNTVNGFTTTTTCSTCGGSSSGGSSSGSVTVNQLSAELMGYETSFGPLFLDNTRVTIPFELNIGSGSDKIGFGGSVQVKTNQVPGCNMLKTVTFDGSFKLTLPSTVTTALTVLKGVLGVSVPAYSSITSGSGLAVSAVIDVASELEKCKGGKCKVTLALSELLPDAKPVLELLGTDVKFSFDLEKVKLFDGGIGMPLYLEMKVLSKQDMKLGAGICGARELDSKADRSDYICGLVENPECEFGLMYPKCKGCNTMCNAIGSFIDTIIIGDGNKALYHETHNLAELLEDTAELANVDLQGIVRKCGTEHCFGIGSSKPCSGVGAVGSADYSQKLCAGAIAGAAASFVALMQGN